MALGCLCSHDWCTLNNGVFTLENIFFILSLFRVAWSSLFLSMFVLDGYAFRSKSGEKLWQNDGNRSTDVLSKNVWNKKAYTSFSHFQVFFIILHKLKNINSVLSHKRIATGYLHQWWFSAEINVCSCNLRETSHISFLSCW